MSETMSEKGIPEAWVGQRVRVGHAHSASTHTDGVLLGLATGALLSRAASWSASTPGPPLGVSRKPTRRVARFMDELACVRKL
jgi:hypothetical protein